MATNANEKIVILEEDTTLPRGYVPNNEIVFIPGLSGDADKLPKLYTTWKEFSTDIPKDKIYKFNSTDQTYGTSHKINIKTANIDFGYLYAKACLEAGLSIIYYCPFKTSTGAATPAAETPADGAKGTKAASATPTTWATIKSVENFYNNLYLFITEGDLEDKGEYNIKYVTSGGYPSVIMNSGTVDTTLANKLLTLCSNRGDCFALVDHYYDITVPLAVNNENSIYNKLQSLSFSSPEYGTMFTPYSKFTEGTLPASFSYLKALANSVRTNPNWFAVAGVTRGGVPGLTDIETGTYVLTNKIAEDYQPRTSETYAFSMNAITKINPYGLVIWGNRTLKKLESDPVAFNFLNIRNMICDIKKLAFSTARSLMFEQDTDSLWLRFKSGVTPLLDQLTSGSGIKGYKIIKGDTKYDGTPLARGEIAAIIRIQPVYAVEAFEITVEITDNDVSVNG